MVKVAHRHHHHHSANSFDLYSPQRSPLHQWESRCKIVGLLGLIIAITLTNHWELTPVVFVVSMGLYWLSKLPWKQWRNRLKYPTGFVLMMVALLPLTAGKTITGWTLGPWAVYWEGLELATVIFARFLCLFTVALILLGSTPLLKLVRSLRAMGLSSILVDLFLLTYRYLVDIQKTWQRMMTAAQLRGFQWQWHRRRHWLTMVQLLGSLLIRSDQQAQRVHQAMILRGYGQSGDRCQGMTKPTRGDYLKLALVWTLSLGLIALNFALPFALQ
ncbi:MAG: cobalt ECF transporter T component CbiQ [Cyanobacteria bacterium P01_C01_bin.89]